MPSLRSLWTKKLVGGVSGDGVARVRPARRATAESGVSPFLPPFRGVVLGIDPSVRGTGLAVLSFATHGPVLLASRTVTVPAKYPFTVALGFIHRAVLSMLADHPVTAAAIEETIYVQNFRTAQLMGAARGAALGPVSARDLPIVQIPPKTVKLCITGNGQAEKAQIQKMIQTVLGAAICLPEDEADAAAVAITAVSRRLISAPAETGASQPGSQISTCTPDGVVAAVGAGDAAGETSTGTPAGAR